MVGIYSKHFHTWLEKYFPMHLLWIAILGNTSKIVGIPIRSVKIFINDKLLRNIPSFRVIHEQGSPLLLVVYLLYDCPKKIHNPHYLVDNPFVSRHRIPDGHPGCGFVNIACGHFSVWSTRRGNCLLSSFFGSLVTHFWNLALRVR